MRVSVALATYNGAHYLPEQLRSIAAQTLAPAELVVSDDCSTDETRAIIAEFGKSAGFPVRFLPEHPRLGFADNFLHAASHCSHELVVFADQDDVWMPTKLEVCRRRMEQEDSLLSLHWLVLTDAELRPTGTFAQGIESDAVFEALQLDPYMTGWGNTMMFRRELLDLIPPERRPTHPGTERPLSHDTWIYTLAAALGRVSHIAAPFLLYRQHGNNVAGFRHGTFRERLREMRTVPVPSYRARVEFNKAMVRLFDELARDPGLPLAPAAARAANAFAERACDAETRLALHTGASLPVRLRMFAAMAERARTRGRWKRQQSLSLLKDFVLGVLRLGHLLTRS